MNVKKIYQQLYKKYGPPGWWPVFALRATPGQHVFALRATPGQHVFALRATPGQHVFAPTKVRASCLAGRQAAGRPISSFRGTPDKSILAKSQREEFGLIYGIPYNQLKKYKTSFRDPYFEIALGAILTQNTAWQNVALALKNLYENKCLTPQTILKTNTLKLQKLIRPAGYFRQKEKKIKIFSNWLIKEFDGDITKLKKFKIEKIREKLLEQWGIGKETADSIILYSLNKPIFVIDAYTKRLCKEKGIEFKEYDEYQEFFEAKLQRDAKLFQEYHALIVNWGKNQR